MPDHSYVSWIRCMMSTRCGTVLQTKNRHALPLIARGFKISSRENAFG